MDNIRALGLINDQYASLFVKEALRFYAKRILNGDTDVLLINELKGTFETMAKDYLDWESRDLTRELERIDYQQQMKFRSKLMVEVNPGVDWGTVERKVQTDDY